MPPVHSAQEQDPECGHRDDDERAEIGFTQQQPRNEQHDRQHRQQASPEFLQNAVLAGGVVRGVEHGSELHELGGLHAE